MDCKNIIKQGEEAKYAVVIQYQGFDQDTDDFKVELSWGLQGQTLTIERNQMISTIGSGHYFVFDTSDMVGRVRVKCTWYVPDIDCPDGMRTVTDEQLLCFVAAVPLPQFACVPAPSECEHYVTYERTEESDIASGYQYLVSSQNDRFITNDSEYILVLAPAPES